MINAFIIYIIDEVEKWNIGIFMILIDVRQIKQ